MTHLHTIKSLGDTKLGLLRRVVLAILICDGPKTPSQLQADLQVTHSAITAALQSLSDQGWITRTVNPDDGRSWIAAATEKARDYA